MSWFKEKMADKPLESQAFIIVLAVGSLTAFLSTVFTAIEGIGIGATLSTAGCLVAMIGIWALAYVLKQEGVARVLLCIVLNLILLPVTFFFCGGVKSGMTLYFLTALYVVVPTIPKRWTRFGLYMASLVMLMLTVIASIYWIPELVTEVSTPAWMIDEMISLFLNASCIYLVATLTVHAYYQEKKEREKLFVQLEEMTIHDELTGLYNRRELFRILEEDVMRADPDDLHCMFIFDVDDFKKVNDTYGHVFGDKVLCEVSRLLMDEIGPVDEGEIAARYGGEEFVLIFHDDDFETSYARAEKIRQHVEQLRFYDNPEFRITISGGVDRCNGMRPRYALRQVDDLLYLAKTTGKNQITRKAF
ncbi:MAG: diguanylate cyclase [Eubacterium sp.]|nr:diguanylate cyclase [Eubacterium sp.]